jgi:hypothetical protein
MVGFTKCLYINKTDDSIGNGHIYISIYPARKAWVYFFSPSSALWNAEPIPPGSAKRNKQNSLCVIPPGRSPYGPEAASQANRAVNI